MNWQSIFEIQDGGARHLEFRELRNFNVTIAYNSRLSTFPPNLVMIAPIVKTWQPIFEIQDGGGGHLEFKKS